MAPQNQTETARSFDPSRDIGSYDRTDFKSRGLTRETSITLYRFLCRLCPPGQSRLVYEFQYLLTEDLQRLAGTRSGFRESSVTKKLQTLERHGFVRLSNSAGYIVEIIRPEEASACRPPEIGSNAADIDHQGKLFAPPEPAERIESELEPATILLFEPAEKQKRNSVSISVSMEKRNSVSVSRTIYPRASRAVDDEVDDDDEVESIEGFCFEETNGSVAGRRTLSQSKLLPSPEKFGSAVDGVARDLRRLRMQRIRIPEPERRDVEAGVPHYENLSLMLRARLTVMAGRLDEAWYLHGIEYVLEFASGSHVKNCFKLLTKDWAKAPDAMRTLSPSRMGLPPDWYDLAAPEILPSGMLPERLQKRRVRQDPESRKSGKEVDWAEIDRLHRKSAKLRAKLEEARLAKKHPERSANGEEPQRE